MDHKGVDDALLPRPRRLEQEEGGRTRERRGGREEEGGGRRKREEEEEEEEEEALEISSAKKIGKKLETALPTPGAHNLWAVSLVLQQPPRQ